MKWNDALKILVVEDEFLIAMEIENVLLDMGHEVIGIASDCQQALDLVADRECDLATVDLRLKGNSRGDDLARKLLDQHGLRSIFVSGSLDEPTRKRLDPMRPYGYVSKPLSTKDLAAALVSAERASDSSGPNLA